MHHMANPGIKWTSYFLADGAPGIPARPHSTSPRRGTGETNVAPWSKRLHHSQELLRPLQLRKQLLLFMKLPRVHAPPAPPQLHRMFQMQHLVEQNIFNRIPRHPRMIKHAADHNRIVRRIIMSQTPARMIPAPGQLRTPHKPMKKSPVQVVKKFFEMIMMSPRRMNVLSPPHLPHQSSLRRNIVAGDISPVTRALSPIHRLAIELRQQYMRNRMQHIYRSALQQVRDPRINLSLPQSNRIVDGDKRIKPNMHNWRRRARPKFAISFVKNLGYLLKHVEGRVARPPSNQRRV